MELTFYKHRVYQWVPILRHHFPSSLWDILKKSLIYPYIQNLRSLYLCYIDNIFMIWTGTKLQFEQFITHLNQQHPSIKFTYKISNEAAEFLDTTVYIDKNNQLQTKLYRKSTDRQNYLHIIPRNLRPIFHAKQSE